MSGFKGQPSPKPSDLEQPTGIPEGSALSDYKPPEGSALNSMGADAAAPDAVTGDGYNGPGADVLAASAYAAPTVGGITGSLTGGPTPAGPLMGMIGAGAGSIYKDIILQSVLKRVPQQSYDQIIENAKGEASTVGLSSLSMLGATKGVQAFAASKLGTAALDGLAEAAAGPLAYVRSYTDAAIAKVYKPFEKILANKVTPLSVEESGNFVKQGFTDDIKTKFSGYVRSYAQLDNVAQAVPLDDVVNAEGKVIRSIKYNFTKGVRDEATDLPQGTYNMVKGYADRFDQARTGADWTKITADLKKEASEAMANAVKYRSNAVRDRAAALSKFADDAEHYFEDKVIGGLAKRVAAGKATTAEMQGFEQMMAGQQGPTVPVSADNLSKYTKSVARDFLKQRDSVKTSYAQFRGLLEDVGDVTRVSPSRMGPMQFAKAINEVPSEKLVERAFDPKNAAALRALEKQYPEIYGAVIKNKMSDIVAKNTSVTKGINYKGIAQAIEDSPVSNHLLTPVERDTMLEVVNSKKLDFLDKTHVQIVDSVVTGLARMGEHMRTGVQAAAAAPLSPAVKATTSVMGQVGARLYNAFNPGSDQGSP